MPLETLRVASRASRSAGEAARIEGASEWCETCFITFSDNRADPGLQIILPRRMF
jgi:hypothetical protein